MESENLEDWGLTLVGYDILVTRVRMVEIRGYQTIDEAQKEFLGVLLPSLLVMGHNLIHKSGYLRRVDIRGAVCIL